MTRIALLGSCQARGLDGWIRLLLPGVTLDGWHVGGNRQSAPEAILAHMSAADTRYDVIITQLNDRDYDGQLASETLRRCCAQVVFLPILVFRGFHPDALECFDGDGNPLLLPSMGGFHSAIAAAAFQLGIPAARVPALFNTLVFRTSGYHTVFAEARTALIAAFAAHGYDIAAPFAEWMRDGAFMYTDNHPHVRVLGTLARQALDKAGFALADVTEPPADTLAASAQWPIYPELVRTLGLPGSSGFCRSMDRVPPGEPRAMALSDWVAEAYRGYAAAGPLAFHPGWVLDETIAALEELAVGA